MIPREPKLLLPSIPGQTGEAVPTGHGSVSESVDSGHESMGVECSTVLLIAHSIHLRYIEHLHVHLSGG